MARNDFSNDTLTKISSGNEQGFHCMGCWQDVSPRCNKNVHECKYIMVAVVLGVSSRYDSSLTIRDGAWRDRRWPCLTHISAEISF